MSLFLVLQIGKYDFKALQAFLALLGPPTSAISTSLSMESHFYLITLPTFLFSQYILQITMQITKKTQRPGCVIAPNGHLFVFCRGNFECFRLSFVQFLWSKFLFVGLQVFLLTFFNKINFFLFFA